MRLPALGAALVLCACDPPADVGKARPSSAAEEELIAQVPATDDAGQQAAPLTPPYNLPAYARLPEGSRIVAAHAVTEDGGPGGIVTYVAAASPTAIAEFHRARLLEAGFTTISDAQTNGARMIGAARADGTERIDIQIAPAPEGTRASLAYRLGDG